MNKQTYKATLKKSIGVQTDVASNYKREVSDWLQSQMIEYNIKWDSFEKHPTKEGHFIASNGGITLETNYKIWKEKLDSERG